MKLLGIIIALYISMLLHIVIHEGGHLIGGLVSGYRFVAFRIGSFQVMKDGGKLKVSRFSLPGTAGQCIMGPPCPYTTDMPYLLYNLGGGIANLATAFLVFLVTQIVKMPLWLSKFGIIFAVIGVGIGLLNLVPMRMEMIDNDGCNAGKVKKSETAKRNFWVQMRAAEFMGKGVRTREMPDELFEMPDNEAMKIGINASAGVLVLDRVMDEMKFEQAWEITEHLLGQASGMLGVHRRMVQIEQIFLSSILEEKREKATNIMTKEMKKFLSARKDNLTSIRAVYAYTLLIKKDEQQAQQISDQFELVVKTYPYKGTIESEKMLMEYAKKIYQMVQG